MTEHPSDADRAGGPGSPAAGLVGTVLAGRYRILRLLGEGAMGAVYLGEHLKFGRKDAIKVLHTSMAQDAEATKRFLRGARNVSAINHPNVCTVYDFGDTDDGLQFLAMEFVEGETLADTLEREGALPAPRAVHIVVQVAAALQAAHDLEIVHRDLKPGNVMLARDRVGADLVKVVDFDIAKGSREGEGSEVTRLGFVVGTPEYMSPEQLIGDPLDGRSDVYSLALVLFRLLTGELPMRSTSTQDLLVERLTQDPLTLRDVAPARGLPAGLQAVFDHALQRRREDRHPTATAFAEDLKAALEPGRAPVGTAEGTPGPSGSGAGTSLGATLETPAVSPPPRPTSQGPEIPATRVSDPGHVPPTDTPAPAGTAGGERRPLVWALGAAAVLAVALGGYAVFSGAPDASTSEPGQPGGPSDPSVAVTDDPGTTTGGQVATADSSGVVQGRDATDDRTAGDPAGESPLPFPLSDVNAVLSRQLLQAENPSRAVLQASADTAGLVLGATSVPPANRAMAGYILAELQAALGDTAAAVGALNRSISLDPGNETYRDYLRALGGGRP